MGDHRLRLNQFVFQEAQEDQAVQDALRRLGQRFTVQGGVGRVEGAGQCPAVFVQFAQKALVNALSAAVKQAPLEELAGGFGHLRLHEGIPICPPRRPRG